MSNIKPAQASATLPREYYDFKKYVTKQRMATYWHQLDEVIELRPREVLEVGVGTGLVASYLTRIGIPTLTADINAALAPDFVASVMNLKSGVRRQFDVVLCARVLHHLPFDEFDGALEQLSQVARRRVVLTLPSEDFSVYLAFRYTSSPLRFMRVPLPVAIKRLAFWSASRSGLWKIGDSREHSLQAVTEVIARHFAVEKTYLVPDDAAHRVFVLVPRGLSHGPRPV